MAQEDNITNLNFGLTTTQVEELTKQGKYNKIKTKTSKTYGKILLENIFCK